MTEAVPGRRAPFVAGAVAVPACVAIAAMIFSWTAGHAAAAFDVAWTSAAVSALAGMFAARRAASPDVRPRWTMWMIAAAAWLTGQLLWDVYGIVGLPESPSPADVCWWATAVIVIISVIRSRAPSRSVRMVALMEAAPVAGAAIALSFAELWHDASVSTLAVDGRVSALIYPAVYLPATVLMVQSMVAGSLRGTRSAALRCVLLGMAVQAIAFVMWSERLLDQTYVAGRTALDPLWVISLILIGIGGVLAARQPDLGEESDEPARYGGILPAVMFVLLIAAFVQAQLKDASDGPVLTLGAGLLLSGAALIARGWLLERRLRVMLARERAALAVLADREAELARLNAQLMEDARHDALTGLRNRRALFDDLARIEAVRAERGTPFALALCDADHFKAYNDHLGHLAGDDALRTIAATVQGTLRPGDIAYRFGGEELLLVLRNAGRTEALAAAERVRAAVESAGLVHPADVCDTLTLSIGVATGEDDTGVLLGRADAALYEAKNAGRNRVVLAADSGESSSAQRRRATDGEALPRHLRSMLAVSRAAGAGPIPALQALAETIRSELSFGVVAVNLIDEERSEVRCVVILGDDEAQRTLHNTASPLAEWERVLQSPHQRGGAIWLPAGSDEWALDAPGWSSSEAPLAGHDAWHPDDMLLLPLRADDGRLLGIVSVDQPAGGRRPDDDQIALLMAVADHAGLAVEQSFRQAANAAAVEEQSVELRLAAVMLLAETLDLRDPGTARHSRTVGAYARQTAEALGLDDERVQLIHAAGVVHDLGKLGIADSILFKPGPLTDAEWDEMQRHPEVGERILAHAGLQAIAAWVRAHHERIDGRGYPDRLAGDEIPLEARILAVADAYEAMIADRPYRAGMPPAAARAELKRCAGEQFDPDVVRAFITALADGEPLAAEPLLTAA